ncbi:MAG: S8 family serine peptidase [Armatimonadetes bacterium]|nr:S8 family serine peptidase [Armatimonadota bacterium]
MFNKSLSMGLLALALAPVAMAGGAGGVNGPFVQQRGVLEFTGTMIVRPEQAVALKARGLSNAEIAVVHQRAVERLRAYTTNRYPEVDWLIVRVPGGSDENAFSRQLMSTGDYEYAVPNWKRYPVAQKRSPNDPKFSQQWHHRVMHSEEAWFLWTGTNNVTVTMVDTGVDKTHEDLRNLLVPGYNSVDRKDEASGGNVQDINGHGTHVAGDICAQGNNSLGVVGEGWNFRLRPVRTSNDPSGSASGDDIFAGARWAADHGSKVISASYSGVDDPAVNTTGAYCKTRGALFLYAAGNDARNLSGFSYKDTIVVGASDENDGRAGFSAFGRGVALFAPGNNILSTGLGGGYVVLSGTSMATPIANGVCAMVWSINPALKPNEVQQIVYNTCDIIGDPNVFGHGRVNLYRAAVAAFASRTTPTVYPANFVTTLQGTYLSGTLANVQSGSGAGWQVRSAKVQAIGESSITQVNYKVTAPSGSVAGLTASFRITGTAGPALTAQVFLWNYSTVKWDVVKSASLPRDGSIVDFDGSITTGMANYIGGDGTVKSAIRVFSPVGRRGEPGTPFTEVVRRGRLIATIRN